MSRLSADLRCGLRLVARNPGFAAVAVLTLALGIGANTAIFSLVDAVLLRPLPAVRDPGQLVSLYRMQKNDPFDVLGYPDYADYRNRSRSFSGLAAQASAAVSFNHGGPERLIAGVVTGNYFSVLGVTAEHGRLILSGDDTPLGAHPVVVLSYSLWQRSFGGDPGAVGATVELNGHPFTVVGIASRQFKGTLAATPADLWVPLGMLDEAMPQSAGHHFLDERAWGWLRVVGRLKAGVTIEQAQAETAAIARQLAQSFPNTNTGRTVALVAGVGLDPDARASVSGFLGLLSGGVALLLLIACANVAGLLLVRAAGRQREIAVRLAMGATRGGLIRQLLTEGLLLALAGGCLGLLLAPSALQLTVALMQPGSVVRHADLSPDTKVLAFTLFASLATGVLWALLPAWRASTTDLVQSLKQGTPGSGRWPSPWLRWLAVGQVAVSFVLLMGAALLVRTMQKVLNADPGFETRNILLASVDLSTQGRSGAQVEAFWHELVQKLQDTPGVVSASLASTVPPEDFSGGVSIFHPGEEPPQEVLRGHEFQLGIHVNLDVVGPHYFRTLRIPLVEGRDFTERDGGGTLRRDQDGNPLPEASPQNGPGVAIINQKLAERLWPREHALGKRISWPTLVGPPRPPLEVIGVTADSRYRSLVNDPPLLMYVPFRQSYTDRATVVVRTASDPVAMSDTLRCEIASLDKSLPAFNLRTMPEHMALSLWQQRMAASLISCFGALALLLATLGLYGVVAYSVAQRTREIGIRLALGAGKSEVFRMVLRQGMFLAVVGMVFGWIGSLVATRFLAVLLYGVRPNDPATFAATSAVLAGVAVLACYVPARRATEVDPIVALRYE